MQFKNSIVLLTALTAGSAVARTHGHQRRHQHQERAVGDWVTAVIDGKTVSWQNTYAGPTAAADAAPAAATTTAAAAVKEVAQVANAVVNSATHTSASKTAAATGFGATTAPSGSGSTYCGNVGSPYGSNIIEISEGDLSNYDYTITLDGSQIDEDYDVIFWNKCSAEGLLTGFFATSFPLTVTVSPKSKSYVAIDTDTQGGFIGYPSSSSIPRNAVDGIVLGFWGEFDFGDSANNGWSGFDVSAIEANIAGISNYPGLLISGDGQTSSITTGLGAVSNAYTQAETDIGGIGGNVAAGPLALTAILNYSG